MIPCKIHGDCIVSTVVETVLEPACCASDNTLGRAAANLKHLSFDFDSAVPTHRVELVHRRCHNRPIAVDVVLKTQNTKNVVMIMICTAALPVRRSPSTSQRVNTCSRMPADNACSGRRHSPCSYKRTMRSGLARARGSRMRSGPGLRRRNPVCCRTRNAVS